MVYSEAYVIDKTWCKYEPNQATYSDDFLEEYSFSWIVYDAQMRI